MFETFHTWAHWSHLRTAIFFITKVNIFYFLPLSWLLIVTEIKLFSKLSSSLFMGPNRVTSSLICCEFLASAKMNWLLLTVFLHLFSIITFKLASNFLAIVNAFDNQLSLWMLSSRSKVCVGISCKIIRRKIISTAYCECSFLTSSFCLLLLRWLFSCVPWLL